MQHLKCVRQTCETIFGQGTAYTHSKLSSILEVISQVVQAEDLAAARKRKAKELGGVTVKKLQARKGLVTVPEKDCNVKPQTNLAVRIECISSFGLWGW